MKPAGDRVSSHFFSAVKNFAQCNALKISITTITTVVTKVADRDLLKTVSVFTKQI
jgi:hypothetical protein